MAATNSSLKREPRLVIARFIARRGRRGAVLWGLTFGIYVASKTIGFAALSPVQRAKVAAPFSNSVGLNVFLGRPERINTLAGYTTWIALSVL
ncbi:MAG TPA: hypothetical protein VNG32_02380, partial [Candidatus Dormibacteraeota bacterium]|nr:hypothetical protein [Candidatus Dormibacteraeota bacterium]